MKRRKFRNKIIVSTCIGIFFLCVGGYWYSERATVSYAESKDGVWSACLMKTYDGDWWEGFLFYNGKEEMPEDVRISLVSDGEVVYENEKFQSSGSDQYSFKQKLIFYKPYKQCDCFMIAFNEEKPKKTVVTISQTSDSGKNDITLVLT